MRRALNMFQEIMRNVEPNDVADGSPRRFSAAASGNG
jgi:hypothetical protein